MDLSPVTRRTWWYAAKDSTPARRVMKLMSRMVVSNTGAGDAYVRARQAEMTTPFIGVVDMLLTRNIFTPANNQS